MSQRPLLLKLLHHNLQALLSQRRSSPLSLHPTRVPSQAHLSQWQHQLTQQLLRRWPQRESLTTPSESPGRPFPLSSHRPTVPLVMPDGEAVLYEIDLTSHERDDLVKTAGYWLREKRWVCQLHERDLGPGHPIVVTGKDLLRSMADLSLRLSHHGAYTRFEIKLLQVLAHYQIGMATKYDQPQAYIHGHELLDKFKRVVSGEDLALADMQQELDEEMQQLEREMNNDDEW